MKYITNNIKLDEKLFNYFFKKTIELNDLSFNELIILNENDKLNDSIDLLDSNLTDLLNYWLPIGSRDEYCLNLALTNNLLKCSVLLLIKKGRKEQAFQILYENILQETNLKKICQFLIIYFFFYKSF